MDTSILKYKLQQKIAGKITNNLITEAVILKADQVPEQPDQGMSWMDIALLSMLGGQSIGSAFRWLKGLGGARGLGRGGIQTRPLPGTSPQTQITVPEPKSTTPQNQKTPRKSPNPVPGTNPARDTNPAPGRTNSGRHKPRHPNSGTPRPTRIGTEVGEEVVEKGASAVGKQVGEEVVEKGASVVGKQVGKEVAETGAIAVGKEVAKDALLKNVKDNIAKKLVAKSLGKVAAKKLPFGLGLLAGAGLAAVSAASGDWEQAGYDLASGTASIVPGVGTAGSVAIDAWAIKRQLDKLNNMTPEELQKMSDELDTEETSEKAAEKTKTQEVVQHKPTDPVRFTPGKI